MFLSIDNFRSASKVMRSTAATLLLSFNFVFIFNPTAVAVEAEVNRFAEQQAEIELVLESTPDKKLAHRLQMLKETLTQKLPRAIEKREQEQGILDQALNFFLSDLPITSSEVSELQSLKDKILEAYGTAIEQFEAEAQIIEDKNLPQIAIERHTAALNAVKTQFDDLLQKLNVLITTEDAEEQERVLTEISDMLINTQFKRSHTPEDPTRLPWGSPSSDVREPVQTKSDLLSRLEIIPYENNLQLASNGFNPIALSAALASFNMPTDEDLQPTIDAPITDDIQALADQLNNDVVEIYTWVHNNIRFIPSYGSIQGAQMTLEAKRGNAMDTASLTIALLRASGIPARYAYGTVEIPVDKVNNWVGGVNNANAAANLLGQGGIPNKAMIMGGAVKYFQLEHTWVEAFVDFDPSRGMKKGQKETWIPLDTSFKQYEFTEGMPLEQTVPFDAQGFLDEIETTTTIDEDGGWVQNVPTDTIKLQLEAYQKSLSDHINTQKLAATVGDVLGLQEINVLKPRPLATGLPYNHIVTAQDFSEVPDNLRYRFKYELGTEPNSYLASPFISIDEPTVKLAGKKLAISFKPATQEDKDIIESYLPEPDPETGDIDASQIPDALPGYLINLIAQFTIDGEVIAEGPAGTMGSELHEELGYWDPRLGWDLSSNNPIAGEYSVIGLDLQGSSPEYALDLKAGFDEIQNKNANGISLTTHDLLGKFLDSTIYSYFAVNNSQDFIDAQKSNIVSYRLPSFGRFHTSLATSYFFGTPRNVMSSGLIMDVDRVLNNKVDRDNNFENRIKYNNAVGIRLSALEHRIPEQMYRLGYSDAKGVSAAKIISLAANQGQKIWNINVSNLDFALSEINLDSDTENEIRNSVQSGLVVTTHENSINYEGWVGEGYIILDPNTGAGAYKISGGMNGGATSTSDVNVGSGVSPSFSLAKSGDGTGVFSLMDTFKCEVEDVAKIALLVIAAFATVMVAATAIKMMAIPALAVMGVTTVRSTITAVFALLLGAEASAGDFIDDSCECESGITSNYEGYLQCWICPAEQHPVIRGAVEEAKALTNELGACLATHTREQLSRRAEAWYSLADSRDKENACWFPEGKTHKAEAEEARKVARNCSSRILY